MRTLLLLSVVVLGTQSASAACPPPAVGTMPEAIAANGQRLLCLQDEISAASRQRQFEIDLQELRRAQQAYEVQRRFDMLPPPYFPPAMLR